LFFLQDDVIFDLGYYVATVHVINDLEYTEHNTIQWFKTCVHSLIRYYFMTFHFSITIRVGTE